MLNRRREASARWDRVGGRGPGPGGDRERVRRVGSLGKYIWRGVQVRNSNETDASRGDAPQLETPRRESVAPIAGF